ncbi:MAG: 30S ribosome-binding factor RbfA [Saprospiraceae bacterium]|nr:30S ribosome-binding factor RbfA [Saprospiraceae bacterium]
MDSKRQLQISEMIKRNFGPIFQQEGPYIYGNAFVTVTTVKITPDMAQAKVYLSIFNADDKELVLTKVIKHTHVLKQALAARIKHQVRRIPSVFFYFDETIDEIYRVDAMFRDLKTKYPLSVQEEE